MHHERSCHVHNLLDVSISSIVLMLSSNTRKTLRLTLRVTIFTKHIFCDVAIITMVMPYLFFHLFVKLILSFILYRYYFSSSMRHFIFTKTIPDYASFKTVTPWYQSLLLSQTYPSNSQIDNPTTN